MKETIITLSTVLFFMALPVSAPKATTKRNNARTESINNKQTIMDNDSIKKRNVTDGRDYLGNFAPKFAEINDDVLFGQVWSREKELSARDRSLITVAALMGSGITDQSLRGHLQKAKENGVTKDEMVEVVTQLAFYTGWPKAWSVFAQMMEVYKDTETDK